MQGASRVGSVILSCSLALVMATSLSNFCPSKSYLFFLCLPCDHRESGFDSREKDGKQLLHPRKAAGSQIVLSHLWDVVIKNGSTTFLEVKSVTKYNLFRCRVVYLESAFLTVKAAECFLTIRAMRSNK